MTADDKFILDEWLKFTAEDFIGLQVDQVYLNERDGDFLAIEANRFLAERLEGVGMKVYGDKLIGHSVWGTNPDRDEGGVLTDTHTGILINVRKIEGEK